MKNLREILFYSAELGNDIQDQIKSESHNYLLFTIFVVIICLLFILSLFIVVRLFRRSNRQFKSVIFSNQWIPIFYSFNFFFFFFYGMFSFLFIVVSCLLRTAQSKIQLNHQFRKDNHEIKDKTKQILWYAR